MTHIYDMLIIGGGPGGYTAALYAARAGLDTILIEKMGAGGQMAMTHQIDNYPGFDEGVDGFELGMKMQNGAERFGAVTENAEVLEVNLNGKIKTVKTTSGDYSARTVVIAAGASPRKLGVPGEDERIGRGVHYCAACDGMFYRGKTIVVVGGGNSAVTDALLLSRIAQKVYVVHRRNSLTATKIYHDPLMQADNVEFLWNRTIAGFLGDGALTGVRLRDTVSGEETELQCDGVFAAIGRKPASELFADQLALDDHGYIIADESTETSIPGVYVVGDIRTKRLRQIVTAVADGATAAVMAEEYLSSGK